MANTDVPASLAGYFFQLLLACRELVKLLNNHDDVANHVAIEKGSDVKVFTRNNVCIEAKFYSDGSFTRNHKSIKHTIYNFFNDYLSQKKNQSPQLNHYIYKTNVPVSIDDRDFFETWNNKTISRYKGYYEYVKDSVIQDSIQRKPYIDVFNDYKKRANVTPNAKGEVSFSKYYNALLEDIKNGVEKHLDYAELLSDDEIKEFINLIRFEFGNRTVTKLYTINEIYDEINIELKTFDTSLVDDDCVRIRNWFIEKFFETISDQVNNGISVSNAADAVRNHRELKIKYLENESFNEFKQAIDESIASFGMTIDRENHEEERNNLTHLLIKCKEKLCEEMDKLSVKEVAGRYVLGSYVRSPYLIMEMLKAMSVVSNFGEDEVNIDLDFDSLQGLNNFALNGTKQYSLKGTENRDFNKYPDALIMEFIKDTQHKFLNKVDGQEIIIFETSCKPCAFAKEGLNQLVVDNAQVTSNVMYQQLFMSMEYRCTECLQLGKCVKDTKVSVQRFLGGGCYGSTV
ncbi:Uncharacterised protein [Mycobacterium tuberculosis]|nr:Uncharacterised protein [Mycobacterium tuberculosis]